LFGRPAYPVDAYWYRAQFVIAATAANAALKKDPTALSADQRARDAWHRAREQAGSLVIGVERALLTGVRGELRTFLQELEPSALILLAGTFIAGDRQEMQISGDLADERDRVLNMTQSKQVNGDFLINMATSLRMSPRAHYNIACYYSSKAVWLARQPVRKKEERTQQVDACYSKSIEELELALSALDAGMKRAAKDDPSLSGVKEYRGTGANRGTRDKFSRLVSTKSQ